MNEFYLSIVAVSRNDDHGGQLLFRMQAFVSGVIEQSKRHDVPIELIIVEWNPPADRPLLSEALKVPQDKGPCEVRIIRVSKELHHTLNCSENLPLFQMIAKNVGIRRARGEYVLASNIDIIFSDELFAYFKKRKLKPGIIYRVDRLDIPSNIPELVPFEKVLAFCSGNFFRINGRYGTKILQSKSSKKIVNMKALIKKLLRKCTSKNIFDLSRWRTLIKHGYDHTKNFRCCSNIFEFFKTDYLKRLKYRVKRLFIVISRFNYCLFPHSNGCGDFTLLSRKDWESLRGYPEWPIFSWHLDSLFLYQAIISNFREKNFGPAKPIYHIEHDIGSGYTPEGLQALFKRLEDKKIPYLTMTTFNRHVSELKKAKKKSQALLYNTEDWGMINQNLEDVFM